MGYSGFDHDIFLSFAHVDNHHAWVEVFQRELEGELNRKHGRAGEITLWFDKRRLQPGQKIDKTIEDALSRTAIFVALTSKGYLHPNTYCHKEIQWFTQQASKDGWGVSVGDRSRVVNVQLANLALEKLPAEFADSLWLKFYQAEYPEQLGDPLDPKEKLFLEQIRKLSEGLLAALETIKNTASRPPANTNGDTSATVPKIFLATTTDSLRSLRNRVANKLRKEDYALVEDIPPPREALLHEAKVTAALQQAVLSVHLFDEVAGTPIDDRKTENYPQRQAELALQNASEILIWVPQELNPQSAEGFEEEAQSHRQFLLQLENQSRPGARYEFIRGDRNELPDLILNKLKQRPPAPTATVPSAALLDTHRKDYAHAMQVSRILFDHKLLSFINPEDDDPRSNVETWVEQLSQVSKLILMFGAAPESWVRARLDEAVKISVNPNCPLETMAVCFAPPNRKEQGIRFGKKFMNILHFNLDDLHNQKTLDELIGQQQWR